jgi:hypothetical protein
MTASGIGLEGHRGNLWSETEQAFTLYSPGYQLAHPCNNAAPTPNWVAYVPNVTCPGSHDFDGNG